MPRRRYPTAICPDTKQKLLYQARKGGWIALARLIKEFGS
jgi:hypothetical protein